MDRGMRRIQQQKASLDEVTNMLANFADPGPSTSRTAFPTQPTPSQPKKLKPSVPEKIMLSPFDIINEERINPSKVGKIQNMFEAKPQGKYEKITIQYDQDFKKTGSYKIGIGIFTNEKIPKFFRLTKTSLGFY